MSTLAGIMYFDKRKVDYQFIASLGESLSPWGPDDCQNVRLGSLAMVHRAFHTTPESKLEMQPVLSEFGHCLTWDGRLDNRKELIHLLGDSVTENHTDATIVLGAYLKWGLGFLSRLVGDYAFALWDPITQMLHLARDPIGTRTLYYHTNHARIFWSSILESILNLGEVPLKIDDEYIADYLAIYQPRPHLTPYKNIYAVEPGKVVTVHNGNIKIQKYWDIDVHHEIRHKNDAEYEEHFLHLFKEAIHCRLRAEGPVYAELSGGLDSSSIVCMADKLMAEGETEASNLTTVSYLTKSALEADEGKYINYLERKLGKKGVHLYQDPYYLHLASPNGHFRSKPTTALCSHGRTDELCSEMSKNRARVLLSGLGGDQVLWSTPDPSPELSDLLYQAKLMQLHRRLRVWSPALKKPYIHVFWREALLPLLPENIRSRYRNVMKPPEWLNSKFVRRLNIPDRNPSPPDLLGFPLPGGRIRSSKLMYIITDICEGYYRDLKTIEIRYPFLHLPLVKFLLLVPFEQQLKPGETRSLQRRALRTVAPEKLLRRKGKGTISDDVYNGIVREWPKIEKLFVDARVCSREYVDFAALRSAFNTARHAGIIGCPQLLQTLSLEIWLRSVEHHYGI
jgi:asparagine synthase (glutamine-hydrolysing)